MNGPVHNAAAAAAQFIENCVWSKWTFRILVFLDVNIGALPGLCRESKLSEKLYKVDFRKKLFANIEFGQ